jgi:acetyl esterase/lipase
MKKLLLKILILAGSLGIAVADDLNPSPATSSAGANRPDIVYGEAGNQKLLLDAHVPDGPGKFPIAILVHGGGWMSGDRKQEFNELFEPLSRANFTWFSIEYRLAPTNRWPACFADVQTAIRWVKQHGPEFKGDPNRIALIGYSAGGYLVTYAGTTAGSATRVQAIVGIAPPTDLVSDNQRRGGLSPSMRALFGFSTTNLDSTALDLLFINSPLSYVVPGLPPFLLVQGSDDKTVPHDQSERFQTALLNNGNICDFITITNAQHNIADWDKFDPQWQNKVVDWLRQKLPPPQ